MRTEHVAERPSWDCAVCGAPWPCGPARLRLRSTMGPTPLAIFLWSCFEEAVGDLPHLGGAEAIKRFLTWTRGQVCARH
ncbi:hypothetical protein AB0M36_01090 [Actinoplanes sp. NPDC051346]|uniref:hypothetical protein n=1 Tax=Actinoplanes sp. NPDC051346 TaxID=3155048 RepID=UPI0034341CC9